MGRSDVSQVLSVRDELTLFLDAISCGADAAHAIPRAKGVCVFGTDLCSDAGEVLADVADEMSPVPLVCVRDNRVPGWVGPDTVAVLISLSGGCGPVLEVIGELERRGCPVAGMTSGGKLAEILGDRAVLIPSEMSETEALGYCIGALAATVAGTGMFDARDALRAAVSSARADIDRIAASSEALAASLDGKVGAFYSTSDTHACAAIARELVSGSAGRLSFAGELPEFDHNELVGWSDPNVHAPELRMVVLRGESRSVLVNRIVGCMMEVLDENGRAVEEVGIGSGSAVARDIRGIMAGLALSSALGVRE